MSHLLLVTFQESLQTFNQINIYFFKTITVIKKREKKLTYVDAERKERNWTVSIFTCQVC